MQSEILAGHFTPWLSIGLCGILTRNHLQTVDSHLIPHAHRHRSRGRPIRPHTSRVAPSLAPRTEPPNQAPKCCMGWVTT